MSLIHKTTPTFYFIGVSTGQSWSNRIFPEWMDVLGHSEVVLEGKDLRIHDEKEAYQAAVAQIKDDPLSLGAIVTTHKLDIYTAAREMFDYLDYYAQVTHELSCISKRGGRLEGYAKDPISAGLSLDAIVGQGYFGRTGAEVLCLGAGGAALATLLHLIHKQDSADRPGRFIAVDIDLARLAHMRQVVKGLDTDIDLRLVHNRSAHQNDTLMGDLCPGSLVINATGRGKDTPGSPITDAALFPEDGIAWEFNYRGERQFLQQALDQVDSRNLRVEDGWGYFVHGWAQVIAEVLHVEMTEELLAKMGEVATEARGQQTER